MAKTWSDHASVHIGAPPERVWEFVADVTRMGDWSPVCRRVEWKGEVRRPEVGARFVGHNRRPPFRWSRECDITASKPGREFAFRTWFRGRESTRWRYGFQPEDGGTRITEAYEVATIPMWLRVIYSLPGSVAKTRRDGIQNMTTTLERIKAAAEGPVAREEDP